MILLPKNKLKDDISGIVEKDDIHPRKYGISSDRIFKDDKKSLLSQISVEGTSVINVNNTLNKFVIINLPTLICKNLRSTISIFTPFFKVTFICYRRN